MGWVGWPAPARWSWPPGPRASPCSTPAPASRGSRLPISDVQRLTATTEVVVAATPTEVVVFDAGTGAERWRAPAPGAVLVSPVLTDDLVVVPMADSEATAASMAMAVTAFDLATGDARWTEQVPGMVNGSPVVLGTVLAVDVMDVGVVDSSQPPGPPAPPAAPLLLGLDLATGTELWRVTGEGNPFAPTVGGSGTEVVAATWTTNVQEPSGAIHAFGADGQARWVADGLVGLGAGAGLVLASTVEGSSVALDAVDGPGAVAHRRATLVPGLRRRSGAAGPHRRRARSPNRGRSRLGLGGRPSSGRIGMAWNVVRCRPYTVDGVGRGAWLVDVRVGPISPAVTGIGGDVAGSVLACDAARRARRGHRRGFWSSMPGPGRPWPRPAEPPPRRRQCPAVEPPRRRRRWASPSTVATCQAAMSMWSARCCARSNPTCAPCWSPTAVGWWGAPRCCPRWSCAAS